MRETKIVLIGAGSASFGLGMLSDAVNIPELRGSTISLVDIAPEALKAVSTLARKMNDESGAGLSIEHTTDRTRALPDAEFVVISIAVRREELWRLDWEVPLKHGVKHTLGENGGPGGLFHCMRNIPVILDICRDIERLCPDALVLNFTNPVPRICMAIDRFTSVRALGLCHGIAGELHRLAQVMGVDPQNLDARAAGLNHFTWILDLRFKDSGEDAYSELRRRLEGYDPAFQPLSRKLFDAFGYYPSPGDDHIGEYLPFATEYCPMRGYDFDAAKRWKSEMWERIGRMVR
jgi:alpha-galactosidase